MYHFLLPCVTSVYDCKGWVMWTRTSMRAQFRKIWDFMRKSNVHIGKSFVFFNYYYSIHCLCRKKLESKLFTALYVKVHSRFLFLGQRVLGKHFPSSHWSYTSTGKGKPFIKSSLVLGSKLSNRWWQLCRMTSLASRSFIAIYINIPQHFSSVAKRH